MNSCRGQIGVVEPWLQAISTAADGASSLPPSSPVQQAKPPNRQTASAQLSAPRDHQTLAGPQGRAERLNNRRPGPAALQPEFGSGRGRSMLLLHRCIEEDSYHRCPRSRQNRAISQHPDPHYPPSYPLAVLNSSAPPSSSSSTSTPLGLSQPSRLLFILRIQLCSCSTPRSDSLSLATGPHNYWQARRH